KSRSKPLAVALVSDLSGRRDHHIEAGFSTVKNGSRNTIGIKCHPLRSTSTRAARKSCLDDKIEIDDGRVIGQISCNEPVRVKACSAASVGLPVVHHDVIFDC